ncbi:hypothetical protein RBB50_008011 [Rhinocladiella similis]
MAQMADPRDPQRPQYPPPDDPSQGGYYAAQSPSRPPARDERSPYPPPDPARPGQYPDPRAAHSYPPPPSWAPQHSAYPPPSHYPDPQHQGYGYPPRPDVGQPPQPMHPDAYRLPPPYPPPGYYPPQHYAPPPPPAAAAPRQRTAIACKYCRKRKIRCSGYDSSPDGRCQNCVRFNQQCLFHPVSSQAAFVPANAVYGPNAARAPVAGSADGRNGHYPREGEQPMLYGAHGQPLGPAGPHGQPAYNYPPPQSHGYPPPPQAYSSYPPPGMAPYGPAGSPYDPQGQAQPAQHDDRVSHKRPPPDDDPHNENTHSSQSPHPNSRPRHSTYDSRANSSGSYEYAPNSGAPTSPATSNMSYQSHPQPQTHYANGNQSQKGTGSPPQGLTPQSAHSFNSPHHAPVHDDGRTPPPGSNSLANNRSMKVHDMLGNPSTGVPPEQRARNDNEMLSKLDGKK